ncbi:MAG: PH domain-containing protein [Verrucomicrobiota bacterium]
MFLINHAGKELEPMAREKVESMIRTKELVRDDWVWDEITESWVPIQELFPENFPVFHASNADEKELDEAEQPTVAVPPADPMAMERFVQLGQRKKIVEIILKMIPELLEPGERLLQIATQRKPMPDFAPEAFALTSQRLFIFEKGHFKTLYDEIPLLTILQPVIKKGIFFSHISMSAGAGVPYGIRFIPKQQGIAFFERLEQELNRVREAQRNAIGANSRKAEGIEVTPLIPAEHNTENGKPVAPQKTNSTEPSGQEDEHKALHHLEDLKIMLDKGLITEKDYDIKKQKILDNEL